MKKAYVITLMKDFFGSQMKSKVSPLLQQEEDINDSDTDYLQHSSKGTELVNHASSSNPCDYNIGTASPQIVFMLWKNIAILKQCESMENLGIRRK